MKAPTDYNIFKYLDNLEVPTLQRHVNTIIWTMYMLVWFHVFLLTDHYCIFLGSVIVLTLVSFPFSFYYPPPVSAGTWRKNEEENRLHNDQKENAVLHCKTYPTAGCGGVHSPVICKLRVKLEKLKWVKATPSFFCWMFTKEKAIGTTRGKVLLN